MRYVNIFSPIMKPLVALPHRSRVVAGISPHTGDHQSLALLAGAHTDHLARGLKDAGVSTIRYGMVVYNAMKGAFRTGDHG